MSAATYQTISNAGFVFAGIFTLAAVILFIKFDIPALIGELSGKTAEKQVRAIREQNRMAAGKKSTVLLDAGAAEAPQETIMLSEAQASEETVILGETDFCVIQDVMEIHTCETIS